MNKNTAQAYSTWQDQDKAERDRILLEQLPQVRYLARRIHERLPRQVPLEDLVHAGVIGLIDALNKFDRSKHVQFGSYAEFRIREVILDSLREMDCGLRELRTKARGIEEAQRKLSMALSRAPTEVEIAAELKLDLREFQHLLTELDGLEVGSLHLESPWDGKERIERNAVEEQKLAGKECVRRRARRSDGSIRCEHSVDFGLHVAKVATLRGVVPSGVQALKLQAGVFIP